MSLQIIILFCICLIIMMITTLTQQVEYSLQTIIRIIGAETFTVLDSKQLLTGFTTVMMLLIFHGVLITLLRKST